jgi:L-serine dehydratase
MGLEGDLPESVHVESIGDRIRKIYDLKILHLWKKQPIQFEPNSDLNLRKGRQLPFHPNGIRFMALNDCGDLIQIKEYYSVGGGFVVEPDVIEEKEEAWTSPKYTFTTGNDLLKLCLTKGHAIDQLTLQNELQWQSAKEVDEKICEIWKIMAWSIERGISSKEIFLPGGLNVRRRASSLFKQFTDDDGHDSTDLLSIYSMAVNEENAAGGRVVTAPTNGAAGIIPAILRYYLEVMRKGETSNFDDIKRFLLTAGTIGMLFKKGASISAAEVGCQGEVGVACSMAAAGLAAALGGSPSQVENAAEIGMEHCLGLTCDPVGGLVQIPCIERNAMGAMKALAAAKLALSGTGQHYISLDHVINTMHQTGIDMKAEYKETSLGGLSGNHTQC